MNYRSITFETDVQEVRELRIELINLNLDDPSPCRVRTQEDMDDYTEDASEKMEAVRQLSDKLKRLLNLIVQADN